MWRSKGWLVFASPGLAAVASMLAGVAYTVYLSLFNYNLLFPSAPKYVGLENFLRLAHDSAFWNAVWVTLIFVLVAATAETALGVAVAYLTFLSKRAELALAIFSIPLILPTLVYVVFWVVVMDPLNGVLAQALRPLGLSLPDFLGNPQLALWAIVALDVLQMTPFVVLIVTAGLLNTPREIWQASAVDGARGIHKFAQLAVPLAAGNILVAYFLRLIDAFRIFVKVALLTRGGPGYATTTMEYLLFTRGIVPLDLGTAAAISVVLLAMASVFIAPYLYMVAKTWR